MSDKYANTPLHGSNVKRDQIPAKYKWAVEHIFTDREEWEAACLRFKNDLDELIKGQGAISDAASLARTLKLRDALSRDLEKIYAYPRLQLDTDNSEQIFQSMSGRAEAIASEFEKASAYIEPEILALDRNIIKSMLEETPSLAEYSFYINNLLRTSEHVLDADQENILAQSRLAANNAVVIFRALVSADIKFPDAADCKGNKISVSEGSYLFNMTSADRDLRRNVFVNLMSTYSHLRSTLASTLTANSRSANFYAAVRKYENALSASLDKDNIPVGLYDGLLKTVNDNLTPLHDYIQLKKDVLGYGELQPYDLYVPLSEAGDSFSCSFDDACAMVQEALLPLGSEYASILRHGFSHGWIDIYENKGKRSGAYSWGVYGVHPFILLNYRPRYNSVSTIAHEMGHALHSYLSSREQSYINADYTIFCAEVASTTNEILLMEHVLKKADRQQKIYLLNQFLETVRTTVYRQAQFAEFEKYIHGEIAAGRSLQADTLDEYWLDSNKRFYGTALEANPALAAEWSRIPHFYTPFYVYKYATGYSAATAFASALLENKTQAREKYLDFLCAGGSDYSLNILQKAGVDLTTPLPVTLTLKKFAAKLEELKNLL